MNDLEPIEPRSSRETTRDDLHTRPREEVENAARKWFEIATQMRDQRDTVAEDLETALNICRSYRATYEALHMPDPNLVTLRNMLRKYNMDFGLGFTQEGARIYADGVDITEHPDSIEGVVEMAELIADEDGNLHLLPKQNETPEHKEISRGDVAEALGRDPYHPSDDGGLEND